MVYFVRLAISESCSAKTSRRSWRKTRTRELRRWRRSARCTTARGIWPVGTDGGRVLKWRGKCGLIGGVTPAIDEYGQVTSALGDRFVLFRLPDANVDDFGAAALRHGNQERAMRRELCDALSGLVAHADITRVNRPHSDDEGRRLIQLAAYTARTRTAVVRDGYQHDVMFLPQVEGRLREGLRAASGRPRGHRM